MTALKFGDRWKLLPRNHLSCRQILHIKTSVLLFFIADGTMILLHGFIKKTQNAAAAELELARKRMKEIGNG